MEKIAVDIDQLLGDLELESTAENSTTISNPGPSQVLTPLVASENDGSLKDKTSETDLQTTVCHHTNGFSQNSEAGRINYDLLDLSDEPDFAPAATSFYRTKERQLSYTGRQIVNNRQFLPQMSNYDSNTFPSTNRSVSPNSKREISARSPPNVITGHVDSSLVFDFLNSEPPGLLSSSTADSQCATIFDPIIMSRNTPVADYTTHETDFDLFRDSSTAYTKSANLFASSFSESRQALPADLPSSVEEGDFKTSINQENHHTPERPQQSEETVIASPSALSTLVTSSSGEPATGMNFALKSSIHHSAMTSTLEKDTTTGGDTVKTNSWAGASPTNASVLYASGTHASLRDSSVPGATLTGDSLADVSASKTGASLLSFQATHADVASVVATSLTETTRVGASPMGANAADASVSEAPPIHSHTGKAIATPARDAGDGNFSNFASTPLAGPSVDGLLAGSYIKNPATTVSSPTLNGLPNSSSISERTVVSKLQASPESFTQMQAMHGLLGNNQTSFDEPHSNASLLANRALSGSAESFTKLQAPSTVVTYPARNRLLEENGIIPHTEEDNMGWDVGEVPSFIADDILRDIGLDEPITAPTTPSALLSVGSVQDSQEPETLQALPGGWPTFGPRSPPATASNAGTLALLSPTFAASLSDNRSPTAQELQSMVVQDEAESIDDSPSLRHTHGLEPSPYPPPYEERDTFADPRDLPAPSDLQNDYLDMGASKPYWIPDAEAEGCMACGTKFTLTRRRHHCRACGKIFCASCCSMKSKLQYLDFKEARVCKTCHDSIAVAAEQQERLLLTKAQSHTEPSTAWRAAEFNPTASNHTASNHSQAATGGLLRDNGSGSIRDSRTVMFSDGIRPGDENSHLDGADSTPSSKNKRKTKSRPRPNSRLNETLRNTFLIPEDRLPPFLVYDGDSMSYNIMEAEVEESYVVSLLRDADVNSKYAFAIHKDLKIETKLVKLDCCGGKLCWCFTSHGLCTVSQDEIVLVMEALPEETAIPKDIFHYYKAMYLEATKGHQVTELGYTDIAQLPLPPHDTGFLDNADHAGFLYVRSSFQCMRGLCLPEPPYVFALLLHRLELPWARLFPLRLQLRLGAEFKYYPCPLLSTRHRPPVYKENGNTIMNLLADFHTFKYSMTKIEGMSIHLQEKITTISIPKNMYSSVMKVVSASQECVIALGASFSHHADSHLVCLQNADGSYVSHAMNIRDQQRRVTGASFVVFNGSMKEAFGMTAKSTIVEDGIMVQISKESLDDFKTRLRNMQEFKVSCGRIGDVESESVNVIWVDDFKEYNIGVVSPIDSFPMDGVMSLRVRNHSDAQREMYTMRWTEVFLVQVDDHRTPADTIAVSQLAETIAASTCTALAPFLEKLQTASLTKLGLRLTLSPEQVEYICGSNGLKLGADMMNALDCELIPVLHSAVSLTGGATLVLELIFHILE